VFVDRGSSSDGKWRTIEDEASEVRLEFDTDDVPWEQDHSEHIAGRIVVALNREFYP
jgi:hypothetical protein